MNREMRPNGEPWWRSPTKLVLIGFSLIGGFFLLAEHRAHVVPYLPWLLLAACPLMHLFGHGHGHGGHEGNGGKPTGSEGVGHAARTGEDSRIAKGAARFSYSHHDVQ